MDEDRHVRVFCRICNERNPNESLLFGLRGFGSTKQTERCVESMKWIIDKVMEGKNGTYLHMDKQGLGRLIRATDPILSDIEHIGLKKTTVFGTPSDPGLVPRLVENLLSKVSAADGTISAGWLECYQEKLFDLRDRKANLDLMEDRGHNIIIKVVEALNKSQLRVPYRDSKLTRLLQDALGGSSVAVVLACLAGYDYLETLNTLQFAAKCASIQNQSYPILRKKTVFTDDLQIRLEKVENRLLLGELAAMKKTDLKRDSEERLLELFNKGTKSELMKLRQVGEARAKQILAARDNNNGLFKSLSDLKTHLSKGAIESIFRANLDIELEL
ncbi:P-loop containing nucleoside triphosphate hydrolase protein [Chytridium lagenaria]|nr:P-loop containing nucleoside triphosphate hydrolase protein [Chytridium lagenaria]